MILVVIVNARQIPEKVQSIADNYKGNTNIVMSFVNAQKVLEIDDSIKSSDIKAGIPFQECYISNDSLAMITSASLDTLDDSGKIFNYLKGYIKKRKKMLQKFRKENPGGQGLIGGQ